MSTKNFAYFRQCAWAGHQITKHDSILIEALTSAPHRQKDIEVLARGSSCDAAQPGLLLLKDESSLSVFQLVALHVAKYRNRALRKLIEKDLHGVYLLPMLELGNAHMCGEFSELLMDNELITDVASKIALEKSECVAMKGKLRAALHLLQRRKQWCDVALLSKMMRELTAHVRDLCMPMESHLERLELYELHQLRHTHEVFALPLEAAMRKKRRGAYIRSPRKHIRALSRK